MSEPNNTPTNTSNAEFNEFVDFNEFVPVSALCCLVGGFFWDSDKCCGAQGRGTAYCLEFNVQMMKCTHDDFYANGAINKEVSVFFLNDGSTS